MRYSSRRAFLTSLGTAAVGPVILGRVASVFRMGADGKLVFARTYDVEVGDKSMWWMGMVPLT
jgi:hypothetical protein